MTVTASSVASVKLEREQIERLARHLRVAPQLGESGALLFRRCLEQAALVATQQALDRIEAQRTARRQAFGGQGEATETRAPQEAQRAADTAC